MHRVLLGLAVGAALTAPASSKSFAAAAFSASSAFHGASARVEATRGVRVHRLIGVPAPPSGDDRRRSRGAFAYPYAGDYYDAAYDINESWDPGSFNDWWHDRPDRAYPRWVWHNRHCSQDRMWWSGAGWRCTP
ncbi:MAG TPA: hypothetical protein VE968_06485 [Sphingomicrobium sp.]|nr:hypothetical protein [Sphingomicrobium sp.]